MFSSPWQTRLSPAESDKNIRVVNEVCNINSCTIRFTVDQYGIVGINQHGICWKKNPGGVDERV